MEKIHFEIDIQAPRETVWEVIIGDDTYREWTSVFSPGSYYVGSWEPGASIRFLAPAEDGGEHGMLGEIAESRRPERISIRHLGVIEQGVEDTTSERVRSWAPAYETYTLTEQAGGTRMSVDMDIDHEHRQLFEKLWPEALQKLKALSENRMTA